MGSLVFKIMTLGVNVIKIHKVNILDKKLVRFIKLALRSRGRLAGSQSEDRVSIPSWDKYFLPYPKCM